MSRVLALSFLVLFVGACSSDDDDFTDASAKTDLAADAAAPSVDLEHPGTDAAMETTHDYGAAGPYTVVTSTASVTNNGSSGTGSFTVTITRPMGAPAAPVVVLASGFFQPATAYQPYATRLASFGIVTITRDDPSSAQLGDLVADIVYLVTTWLPAANADTQSVLHGAIDTSRVGVAGHSRGGQAMLLAAEGGAKGKVLGAFGIDPVDSDSGGGQARTALATIGAPLVLLGETTDGTGGMFGMPCAPAADNFQALYALAASPTVEINVLNADHTQFEDPATCSACFLCTAGTANAAQVLAVTVKYTTAFFGRVLLGDATVGATFDGAGAQADIGAGTIQLTSK